MKQKLFLRMGLNIFSIIYSLVVFCSCSPTSENYLKNQSPAAEIVPTPNSSQSDAINSAENPNVPASDEVLTPAISDPGIGTGLWKPFANQNTFVADQSGTEESSSSIVPGCLNGGDLTYGAGCRNDYALYGVVKLTLGTVVSIRYRPQKGVPVSGYTGYFKLSNIIGGNITLDTTISLSKIPGDFSNPKCMHTSTRQPRVLTGTDSCTIDQNAPVYYFNIRANAKCDNCVVVISELSQELK